jgi:murein L,D-transpeptidase YcbB/YkuD
VQTVLNSPQLSVLKWANYADQQDAVKKFYGLRNSQLAWTIDAAPTAQATGLIQLFTNAAQKGLNAEDYDASRWPQRVARIAQVREQNDTSDAAQSLVAQFDVAVTISALRYLSDLHLGRINPQTMNWDIDVPAKRAAFDAAGFLNENVTDAGDVALATAAVEPQNAMYRATEQGLAAYLQLAQAQDANRQPALPAVEKTVEVGGAYSAAQALLSRLQLEGDAAAGGAAAGTYDAALSDAVKHYQGRHGLTVDGKLTQATIDSLNVPMDQRVVQIGNALEHWRWLPDEFANPRVLVNLPEFFVRAYEPDHTLAFKMKVVDGEARGQHDTPVFVQTMRYMIFRPYWNLPSSIVKKELVRHLGGDGGQAYLDRNHYEVLAQDGKPVTNWTAEDLEHSRLLVRQKPGPGNALGLVKFMFPNEYNVYMHSTPEMSLFNLTRRDRSHGCVRLNDAEKMADWVLGGEGGDWDADKIHAAMFNNDPTKQNRQVNLKTTLAVNITYLTANADEDGSMHFFDDIYGYDKDLDAALAKGRPYEQAEVHVKPQLPPGGTE